MSSVIIFKKDLENLGRKLMKEFYHQIHDNYFLKEYEEVRLKRKYYDENLTKEFLSFCEDQEKITNIKNLYFHKTLKDLLKMNTEDLLSNIETKIKDETLDVEIIFRFLSKMDLNLEINQGDDFELDEDLFCMKKAFINIFNVFHYNYKELED